MSQLRLLMVLDSLAVGGTETQVLSVIVELQKLGAHVVVVAGPGSLCESYRDTGCVVEVIPFPLTSAVRPDVWRQTTREVQAIMTREEINRVHAHQTPSARFVYQVAKELGIPFFFTVHGTYYDRKSLLALIDGGTTVLSVSPPVEEWLQSLGVKSTLVPNGIDLTRYQSGSEKSVRVKSGIPDDATVVVYASRLAWEKADICIQFLDAAKHLRQNGFPTLHALVAGDGAGAHAVRGHMDLVHRQTQFAFIHMLGECLDMVPVLCASDGVVGTGRVALEAMACERPVIAVGCQGLYGLVDSHNYDDAFAHYYGDHRARCEMDTTGLAVNMAVLLAMSRESRRRIGSQSRNYVETHFDVRAVTRLLWDLYQSAPARTDAQ